MSLAVVKGMLNLKELQVAHTRVQRLGALTKLQQLVSLDLSGTLVSDSDIAILAKLTNLQSINVRYTDVSDRGLNTLRTFSPQIRIQA